jgi:hypothetical protein
VSFASNILATQSASLSGFWKCNEDAGSATLSDYSGNGFTATLHGTPATDYNLGQAGEHGNAIQFLGSLNGWADNSFGIGMFGKTELSTQDFTMMALLKGATTSGCALMLSTNTSTFPLFDVRVQGTGNYGAASVDNGNSVMSNMDSAIASGTSWRLVVFTRNVNTWRVYVDGIVGATTTQAPSSSITIDQVILGKDKRGANQARAYNGLMQYAAIWRVALGQNDITTLQQARSLPDSDAAFHYADSPMGF